MRDPTICALLRCHRDSGLVARVAALLKSYVDEVVIVADEQMAESELGAIAASEPSSIIRLPHAGPNERASAYMLRQCRSEWILRVSGDEIPSLQLLRDLRRLVADRCMTHYRVAMAWLWPDAGSVLAERPWWPDPQTRLHRNDEGILHYPGITHGGVDLVGNHRYLETPIYHLALVLLSEEERMTKVTRYDQERPGLRVEGEPFNALYHFPENRQPPPRTRRLPGDEISFIHEILDGGLESEGPPHKSPLVSQAEIDALWASRRWEAEAYEAALETTGSDLRFPAEGVRILFIGVENRGTATWPSAIASAPLVRLSYHWFTEDGALAVWDGLRSAFPGPVGPGERALVPAQIESPGTGKWILELDIVHEFVRWFGANFRLPVEIP